MYGRDCTIQTSSPWNNHSTSRDSGVALEETAVVDRLRAR
jgi:hypothetical protein